MQPAHEGADEIGLVANISNMELPEEGTYTVELYIDENLVESKHINVTTIDK